MAWKPFVNQRSLATQAFKQAIVEERGYNFPKFKKSRLEQRSFLRKLLIGVPSNYHEIVKKNLATVYLGYVSYLNPLELHGTELSGGWLSKQKDLSDQGYRDLTEYHFFAIDYVDENFLDKAAKKLGAEADLAAIRVAAPEIAKKVAAIGGDVLGVSREAAIHQMVRPYYQLATGIGDGIEKVGGIKKAVPKKLGYGSQELFDRVGERKATNLKSIAPANLPSQAPGEAGGLRMGLTDNYGVDAVYIEKWQFLAVRKTTLINISRSPITCSPLSSIHTGPVDSSTIILIMKEWDRFKRHPPAIYTYPGRRRCYWYRADSGDLKYYDLSQGGEFEKMYYERDAFQDWVPYSGAGPRRAMIDAIPLLPYGVGPEADLDM